MDAALLEMLCGLPPATQRTWVAIALPGIWDLPRDLQAARLRETLAEVDFDPLRTKAAASLVRETALLNAVPAQHAEFRPMVEDAVTLLLSRLSRDRLQDLLIGQLVLPPDSTPGERLVELCICLPTLWKLGQIVGRKPGIAPDLHDLLSRLENGIRQADPRVVQARTRSLLGPWEDQFEFEIPATVLAEGSVGVVLPLRWRPRPGEGPWNEAVAKLIKPEAGLCLPEEMGLIDEVCEHFERNRSRYPAGEVAFRETAREVKEALRQEIDLPTEQHHLRQAAHFFSDREPGAVPVLLPFSTPEMTVMTRMPGEKVTEAGPAPALAARLFRLLILEPLFDPAPSTVFHGDPHAGNLFRDTGPEAVSSLHFLDWSQAGRLTREQREALLQVALGTLLEDRGRVQAALQRLACPGAMHKISVADGLPQALEEVDRERHSLLGRALSLVDRLFRMGMVFPRDLLVLRKSLFTLDGVLADLDPTFDQDLVFQAFLRDLLVAELPDRWLDLATPWWDRPSRYRTFLSNLDLQAILHRLSLQALHWSLARPARWWLDTVSLPTADPIRPSPSIPNEAPPDHPRSPAPFPS